MNGCNLAIVGATGAVGQVFLGILEARPFPLKRLSLFASKRSVGKRIKVRGEEVEVREVTPGCFDGVDIAFISVSSQVSKELAPLAVRSGALVIDDSSAFRMEKDVPLVVPEINAEDLQHHKGIVAIPNCSTTQMVMALYPIHRVNPIKRIVVDTYQSVSGTGRAAMEELKQQTEALLRNGEYASKVYPHPIGFNLFPHIDSFLANGYTREEWKMVEETRKIMHAPNIAISATCVRVPVYISHSEAVHIELTRPMSVQEARETLATFPGVQVVDDVASNSYPTPIRAAGRDEVFVGRIRQDASHPNGLAMWVVSDNLRKGAALDAIQIAEEVLSRRLLLSLHGR
ncbi:MAG: aspartate-semialdehyde dehydrogenase [Chloroflexi bacterium]|nr:aspartate-semialdehyde dehydrogenase [Chloroflexota bacterium]